MSNDEEICFTFNEFFPKTKSNLNISAIEYSHPNLQNTDPILVAVNSYDKHPSIERIRNRSYNLMFSFSDNLNINKACQNSDIPTNIVKLNKGTIAPFISENFKSCIDSGEFSNDLKHVDIAPVHQKKSKTNKTNYRLLSILSNVSRLYKKLMYKQLYLCCDTILSSTKCGFREEYT